MIMGEHFIGFDYEARTIQTNNIANFVYDGGGKTDTLKQSSLTAGGGINLTQGLTVVLEWNTSAYDNLYGKFNYTAANNTPQKRREMFNARFAYNW